MMDGKTLRNRLPGATLSSGPDSLRCGDTA
jgi:hypothetical protein